MIRIEQFIDPVPENPSAYVNYMTRMAAFLPGTPAYGYFNTVALDSLTYFELAARFDEQFRLNKDAKDPRQWWAQSTDKCERLVMVRLGALPHNVVVCAHIDEDKDDLAGTMVRNPAAPGRLRKRVSSGFEFYRSYGETVKAEGKARAKTVYRLQTAMGGGYNAGSCIEAPDGCASHYANLWANWHLEERPAIHVLVYGESGSGKSTFTATMPRPLLVWAFDMRGKEIPYLKGAKDVVNQEPTKETPYRVITVVEDGDDVDRLPGIRRSED